MKLEIWDITKDKNSRKLNAKYCINFSSKNDENFGRKSNFYQKEVYQNNISNFHINIKISILTIFLIN